MRRTRADLEQAAQAAERENTLLRIALQCVLSGEIDTIERCRVPADQVRYELRLVRATGAHGGIVLVTTYFDKQRPSTEVAYLDDFHRRVGVSRSTATIWALGAAVDKLFAARQRLLDAGRVEAERCL